MCRCTSGVYIMPRLTAPTLSFNKPIKKFTNYKYRAAYTQVLPPELKNKVASKGDRKKISPCLQEMSQMLVCLKESEYNQGLCSKEIDIFNKCHVEYQTIKKNKVQAASEGKMSAVGGRVNSKQLNKFLRKYPQQNPK